MRHVVILFSLVVLLVPVGDALAQILPIERAALLEFYSATGGAAWRVNTGWTMATVGEECLWYGVACAGGRVTVLDMYDNLLTGSIPPVLGNLGELTILDLGVNQLGGSIPPSLGTLGNLVYLYVDDNRLIGTVPSALGDLSNLVFLALGSNKLVGTIPTNLVNLTNLTEHDTDFGYNALHTDDEALRVLLDVADPDWEVKQTIPPAGVSVGSATSSSVVVSWTPILYAGDDGWYSITATPMTWFFADGFETGDTSVWTAGVPSSTAGSAGAALPVLEFTTEDKTDSSILADGLLPNTQYVFVVRTVTESHEYNQNQVVSEASPQVLGTTAP